MLTGAGKGKGVKVGVGVAVGVGVGSTIDILGDGLKYLEIGIPPVYKILSLVPLVPSPKICQRPKTVFLTPPDMTEDGIT